MSADQSLEELQLQLTDNQSTLESINELLFGEPDNIEYQQLYHDINELIQSIQQIIQQKQSNASNVAHNTPTTSTSTEPPLKKSRWGNTTTTTVTNTRSTIQSSSTQSAQQPIQPSPPTNSQTVNDQIQAAIKARLLKPSHLSSTSTTVQNNSNNNHNSLINWSIGDRCTAIYSDNKPYTAVVQSVPNDSNDTIYSVLWLDFGNTTDIDYSNIHIYKSMDINELKPNMLIRAIYPDDGLLHDAIYIGPTPQSNSVSVKFTKKKRIIDVLLYDIVHRPVNARGINGVLSLDESIDSIINRLWPNVTIDDPVLPHHLQLNDNDTYESQKIKQKKIKLYTHEWQKTYQNIALKKQQQSWNKFKSSTAIGINKSKLLPGSNMVNKPMNNINTNLVTKKQLLSVPHNVHDDSND